MIASRCSCKVCGRRLWWTEAGRRWWTLVPGGSGPGLDEAPTPGKGVPDTCPEHRLMESIESIQSIQQKGTAP